MIFNPGDLNKRIVLLTPVTEPDDAGGAQEPTASPPIWASIDTPYGQNLFQGQFVAQATHKVVIRYRAGVTAEMKVQYGTRTFNILYVGNPKEASICLWLFCEEST